MSAMTTTATPLCGLRFDALTTGETVDHIFTALDRRQGGWVVTANLDILRQAATAQHLRDLFEAADLTVADGMPIVWAARLAGRPLPERVAGSGLVYPLCERAAAAGRSVFLLGGNPGVADAAAELLAEHAPGLRIAGTHCPPLGFEDDPDELACIRRELLAVQPDIVLVCLGAPKQERLIARLRGELPSTWFLGLGITLSFVTGEVSRAPRWMQRSGLEWIHRLVQEPSRLARRYLLHGLPFAARLAVHALALRLAGTAPAPAPVPAAARPAAVIRTPILPLPEPPVVPEIALADDAVPRRRFAQTAGDAEHSDRGEPAAHESGH